MKKLLVLVAVLAVASLANAVIMSPMEIVKNLDGTYGINMPVGMSASIDGPSGGYFALIGVDGSAAVLTAPAFFDGASITLGTGPDIGLEAGIIGGFTVTGTWTVANAQAAGVYATGFTALEGVKQLQLWQLDDGYAPTQIVATYDIPEPATIAVLSLGGLLLRRKK